MDGQAHKPSNGAQAPRLCCDGLGSGNELGGKLSFGFAIVLLIKLRGSKSGGSLSAGKVPFACKVVELAGTTQRQFYVVAFGGGWGV